MNPLYHIEREIQEVNIKLEQSHLVYLETDESPLKLDQRHKLEALVEDYSCLVTNDRKFIFEETADILYRSATTFKEFSAYKACTGWSAISLYASNLLSQSWRKEYKNIKTFSGFYKHEIEANLVGAELMFELMGYAYNSKGVLCLNGPVDPDKVSNVSRDAIVASVECKILKHIWEEVSNNFSISWLEILDFRKNYIGTPEQAIRALNHRYTEKLNDYVLLEKCFTINKTSISLLNDKFNSLQQAAHIKKNNNKKCSTIQSNNLSSSRISNKVDIRHILPSKFRGNEKLSQMESHKSITSLNDSASSLKKNKSILTMKTEICGAKDSINKGSNTKVDDINNAFIREDASIVKEMFCYAKDNLLDENSAKINNIPIKAKTADFSCKVTDKQLEILESVNINHGMCGVTNKWNCETCTYLNVGDHNICQMCGKSRLKGNEDEPLISGGKECPKCTLINKRDVSVCDACETNLIDSPTYI